MNLSLRNLVRCIRGRNPARRSARPSRTTRLHVEALEERAVPTVMNLTGYTFSLPGATLQVTGENVVTGHFAAIFHDLNSKIDIPINMNNGLLQPIGPNLDKMVFQGIATKGLETEKVVFNGDLHEAVVPLMFGQLTETYSLPIAQWTVSKIVEGPGRRIPSPFPLPASNAAALDAFLTTAASRPVAVNPQPLPPHAVEIGGLPCLR